MLTGKMAEQFLTTEEVAGLLRVSIYTVRRWIRGGDLPAYKVGRGLRVKKADLDQWIEQQSTTGDSPASANHGDLPR